MPANHPAAVSILYYNDDWGMAGRHTPDVLPHCRALFDRARLSEADIVVFHIPTLHVPGILRKRPGQCWVAWSMESSVNYPLLADPGFMAAFDWTMTYRRDADVWVPYLDASLAAGLAAPPQEKSAIALAVYFASNMRDRSGRMDYVRELMRHMAVDSYGKCLQNRRLPVDDGRASKLATLARYRFTLAFENSIEAGYVTEKYYDPLIAGSVPVYLGAPDIDAFAPGPRCHINAGDFPTPRALAEHLRALAADEDAYQLHLAWKAQPLSECFLAMVERTRVHHTAQLAELFRRQARLEPVSGAACA
jgi:alpha-1,3-fucosyltransferase 10